MAIADFDKLNVKSVSIPYDEYFEVMDLTREQINERISAANDFEHDFLFLLSLLSLQMDVENTNYDFTKAIFAERWGNTASKYVDDDEFVAEYSRWFADGAVEATLNNPDDPWMFSDDRAMFNAENEANTVLSQKDYVEAILKGYTRKQWKGINDGRERKTHIALNDKIIPIDKYYQVGDARMLFAKDLSSVLSTGAQFPEEYVNCRCSVRYLK